MTYRLTYRSQLYAVGISVRKLAWALALTAPREHTDEAFDVLNGALDIVSSILDSMDAPEKGHLAH